MPRTDNVPHLLHVFSTFAVGGPQTRMVSLANALQKKYRHTVLSMDGRTDAAKGFDSGVEYTIASMPVAKNRGISLANLRHARRLLRELAPNLLITYNWGSIEWALANDLCPLARHIHLEDGFGPDETPDRQAWRRVIVRRVLLSRCASIIVPSRTLYDIAIGHWHFAAARVVYIPNGIDYRRFARPADPALLAQLHIADGQRVVGTVAALRREKNLPRLVRTFARARGELDARLVIVGEGPERQSIVAAADALGISDRVLLVGAMEEPERLLGRFDVFALTSDTEQMPNAILEAMGAGLAILATDVGDVMRMVAGENKLFIIPCGDEKRLVDSLSALLADSERRLAIGRANQEYVRTHFDLDATVQRYDALFLKAMQ